jgi:VanZ family protein
MSPRLARIALAVYLAAIYATLGVVRTITNFLRDQGVLRISIAVAFVLSVGLILTLIFRDPRRRSRRFILALLAIALVYAAAIFPMDSPEEKIHFIEYGVVALLAYEAFPVRRRYLTAAVFVLAAGWIDELIQGLLPTRYYDLRDVAFNAAAGLLALLARYALTHDRLGAHRPEEMARDAARGRTGGERP